MKNEYSSVKEKNTDLHEEYNKKWIIENKKIVKEIMESLEIF